MKRLILLELTFLFLATTFQSDNPPGWYQQTLPVSGTIQDIFFLDSLKGWVVNNNGYILHSTNGGDEWNIQKDSAGSLYSIQMVDSIYGYVGGTSAGHRKIYKTIDGGENWIELNVLNPVGIINEVAFINKDTGWVCSQDAFDGGVFKTTDGGISWVQQWDADHPNRIQFINSDTGWTAAGRNLYRTTNGGTNWNLLYTFPFSQSINDVFFFNGNTGIVTGGVNYRSTDGGYTWIQAQGNVGGIKISMGTDSVGWAGTNAVQRIRITTNGGISWGSQEIILTGTKVPNAIDHLTAWAGGSNGLMHTTDGGGLIINIHQISTEIPDYFMLYQNYPNPFNPKTIIKYQILSFSKVTLKVFDISGKEITGLINENQSAGTYQYEFDGNGLSSGVYFYRLEAKSNNSSYIETKKMILAK